jgi:hypothetical protein
MLIDLINQGNEACYKHYVEPYTPNFTRVTLEDKDFERIRHRAKRIIEKKKTEIQNLNDSGSMLKRWVTGWCGERVVEKYLDIEFMDLSIGESYSYNTPDLLSAGFRVGVKTCNVRDFPLMKPPTASHICIPEIFVIKEDKNNYLVAGIGNYEVLNNAKNYTRLLVRSSAVQHKQAFYRFDLLKHRFDLNDLETA